MNEVRASTSGIRLNLFFSNLSFWTHTLGLFERDGCYVTSLAPLRSIGDLAEKIKINKYRLLRL